MRPSAPRALRTKESDLAIPVETCRAAYRPSGAAAPCRFRVLHRARVACLVAIAIVCPAVEAATAFIEGDAIYPADPCGSATTQADLATCAHEDFLAASKDHADRYQALSTSIASAQRDRLRRLQSAWLGFRTAACRYESGPVNGGSAEGFVYWNCVARLTRERADQLARLAECREGDLACSRRRP